jgi:lipopolysaccharide/colanic/teichoic acid biosynthesis glycosyltransferase
MGTGSITLQNDFRVTKIGTFLRKTKINELPQIINILKGDISLVGPRPLVKNTFISYSKDVQSKIYNVKPGLTGIGSIIFRDEEFIISAVTDEDPHEFYKRVIAPFKGELEMWYQTNCSFFLDLQLIFMTAWVILFPNSKLYEKWFKNLPKRNF